MPDTYLSFVIGYSLFWVFSFVLIACLLKKVLRIEKEFENLKNSLPPS